MTTQTEHVERIKLLPIPVQELLANAERDARAGGSALNAARITVIAEVVKDLQQCAGALGPLISEAVAASKPGPMREDAIRRRDNFYAALLRAQEGAK